MSTRTADINTTITIHETSAKRFRSEGVTAFTLCDGALFGFTFSNGRKVGFNVRALDVAREVIRSANRQERALLKKIIEETEG